MTPETDAREAFASFRFSAISLPSEDHDIAADIAANLREQYSDPSEYLLRTVKLELPKLEQAGTAVLYVTYEDYWYYNNSGPEMTMPTFAAQPLRWQKTDTDTEANETQRELAISSVSTDVQIARAKLLADQLALPLFVKVGDDTYTVKGDLLVWHHSGNVIRL